MRLLPVTTPTTRVERAEAHYAQIAATPATLSDLDAILRWTGIYEVTTRYYPYYPRWVFRPIMPRKLLPLLPQAFFSQI